MELITLLSIIRNGTTYTILKDDEFVISRVMERVVEGSQPRRRILTSVCGTEEEIWLSRAGINLHERVVQMTVLDKHVIINVKG